MQSSEQVVSRILDLDQRADGVRAAAREEADAIRRETAARIAGEKEQLERRIAGRISEIESDAAKARVRETGDVTADFERQAGAVSGISPEKKAKVADVVVSRIRERAS